jgi:hypothetical protein
MVENHCQHQEIDCGSPDPKASPDVLERQRPMFHTVLSQKDGKNSTTRIYQKAVCPWSASHRKIGTEFSKI